MIEPIRLPKLAANMKSGKITKWLKQVGEQLNTGEPLVEVTTGKVNVQVDSPFSGELLEILIPEGAEAPVGAEIATIKTATDEISAESAESAEAEPAESAELIASGVPRASAGTSETLANVPDARAQSVRPGVQATLDAPEKPITYEVAPEGPGAQTARGTPAEVEKFDIVIIGGGPGGYVAAIRASQLGKEVALVENDKLGGTCLNRGCIPSKAMIKSAELYTKLKNSAEYGVEIAVDSGAKFGVEYGVWPGTQSSAHSGTQSGAHSGTQPGAQYSAHSGTDFGSRPSVHSGVNPGAAIAALRINFPKIMERKNTVVSQLRAGVEQLMHNNKVRIYNGTGSLIGENRVDVALPDGNIELSAKDIIIASGSLPASLPVPGAEEQGVLNSDTVFEIDQIPDSIVIIGGGYIAIEMGCFFNAMGSKVTIIEMQPRILPFADHEIGDGLHGILVNNGISIHTDTKVKNIAPVEGGGLVVVATNSHEGEKFFYCEKVLNATGRVCNSEGLNLGKIGIEMDGRAVKVNEKMQTNIPNIYAIGDVTGKAMLAHVASYEGIVAVENIAGFERKADHSVIPSVIFSNPEIGYTGLTEAEAREQKLEFTVSRFPFAASGKALTAGETEGKCKLICCKNTGKVLGAHIIGPRATDLIATLAVSMKNGITAEQLTHTIFAHPTTAEVIMEAAGMATGKPIHFPGGNLR